MYQELIYSKQTHISTITLNRPESKNSLSAPLIDEIVAALEEFHRDDDARVLVLTGAGDAFCSGGDIQMLLEWAESGESVDPFEIEARYREGIHRIPRLLAQIEKPVIAAVNGAAAGAGCDLALMADIRIASEEARFGEVFCKIGIAPGDGGCYFLTRIVGIEKACELIFTGDVIDAREALRIGMISRVVPAGDLMATTYELAERIASRAILAIRYSKRAIYSSYSVSLDESLDSIARAQGHLHRTEDHREGLRAFVEKRPPRFSGK